MKLSSYILLVIMVLFSSCGRSRSRLERMSEDKVAKQLLQGVWLDDVSDMPVFKVSGDTLRYVDIDATPLLFKIIRDSIYLLGEDTLSYKIARQGENTFWLETKADNLMKLHRSESDDDQYAFNSQSDVSEAVAEPQVVQKDSVIVYDGVRYRGYVFINPSKYKVVRQQFDETGISIEQVYYDNIIHICVYEGANELYGRDISKSLFADHMEAGVLPNLILSDMDFSGVDAKGYHYRALLKIPDSSVSYSMNLTISPQGDLDITTG